MLQVRFKNLNILGYKSFALRETLLNFENIRFFLTIKVVALQSGLAQPCLIWVCVRQGIQFHFLPKLQLPLLQFSEQIMLIVLFHDFFIKGKSLHIFSIRKYFLYAAYTWIFLGKEISPPIHCFLCIQDTSCMQCLDIPGGEMRKRGIK